MKHAEAVPAAPDEQHAPVNDLANAPLPTQNIGVAEFLELLADNGLAKKLPGFRARLDKLARSNRATYGFSFNRDDPRLVHAADIPRMLLGLREGILTQAVVIDSPSGGDMRRLKLDPLQSMLALRFIALKKSGLRFLYESAEEIWTKVRTPENAPLWTAYHQMIRKNLVRAFDALPPPPTIFERRDSPPRLVLVGRNSSPRNCRVLVDLDGQPGVRQFNQSVHRSIELTSALAHRASFLTPEAALILMGSPGVRVGKTTLLARPTHSSYCEVMLAGLLPKGKALNIRSFKGGEIQGGGMGIFGTAVYPPGIGAVDFCSSGSLISSSE